MRVRFLGHAGFVRLPAAWHTSTTPGAAVAHAVDLPSGEALAL